MNHAVNFFWTIVCFGPVVTYWVKTGPVAAWWYFIGVSFLGLVLPASWLRLSRDPKFYERLGVRFIRKFVQDGDYAKRGRRIISNKTNARQYTNTILMYEKYHFLCLLFFLLTSIHAIIFKQYFLTALIIIANSIYNVCPLLLQQYNKARLVKMLG